MKTVSGQLYMTKREEKNIRLLLAHVVKDISYGGSGTYSLLKGKDTDYCLDEKNACKAKEALNDILWILSVAVIK